MLKRVRQQQYNESLSDTLHRYRGVILVISVPLLIICVVLFLMPSARSSSNDVFVSNRKYLSSYASPIPSLKSYDVVFDAGSSGSLSANAKDPKAAAKSLLPLLEKAEKVVPRNMRKNTPVKVGATAGLRQLGTDASERILQAVRKFLKAKSSLKSDDNSVTVLDGTQESAYQWVTINCLLKRLGKNYNETVGVVDLGGGSVQMAYAISEAEAAKAPRALDGEDTFVKEMSLLGTKYYLYVHSYLHYGLLASRAEILGSSKDSDNPCVLSGYNGVYSYGGTDYKVSSPPSGSSMIKCREEALKALKVNDSSCAYGKCTFGGVWNSSEGGGGDEKKILFVT
ncbi:hypothetical protein L1987_84132 [Smallanthus sonchifolius]|uniref:Uncharacterized protein n=1 Tax=Smallanthus sonchifolius TaxID=185202 RepID=A0ACB8YET7_9ASTR|nr:hypothetical protein L1987_84132 [Smallanthus sonchifolius]